MCGNVSINRKNENETKHITNDWTKRVQCVFQVLSDLSNALICFVVSFHRSNRCLCLLYGNMLSFWSFAKRKLLTHFSLFYFRFFISHSLAYIVLRFVGTESARHVKKRLNMNRNDEIEFSQKVVFKQSALKNIY